MSKLLRWGILSTSKFARTKVLPALKRSTRLEVSALASRDSAKAEGVAEQFDIPKVYGTYEELLADPGIDVVYNPLPNHLHVPWSIKALEAGKHVLCEKPLGMNSAEVEELISVRDRTGLVVGEAFMVATHPQWLRTREIVWSDAIGELRAIQGFFSYTNVDPANIRNRADYGGGGMMDIGCYPIFCSRFVTGREPLRVAAMMEFDATFGTDRLSSVMLDFGTVQAQFTCSTQLVPYQRMQFFGSKGRVEVLIPFNAPPDSPARIHIDDGRDLFGGGIQEETFSACDQYTLEGDAFSAAVLGEREVPVSLESARGNMRVIEAAFTAAREGRWIDIPK